MSLKIHEKVCHVSETNSYLRIYNSWHEKVFVIEDVELKYFSSFFDVICY